MDTSGNITVLHSFGATQYDGLNPSALIQASDGNFYGTTYYGGVNGDGTAFRIDRFGHVTILHSFGDPNTPNDGTKPSAALIQGADGNFYGTTYYGGANSFLQGGTAFRMTTSGNVTVLHSFGASGSHDGTNPSAALIQGADGNFYGTTYDGGTNGNGDGTVFKLTVSATTVPARPPAQLRRSRYPERRHQPECDPYPGFGWQLLQHHSWWRRFRSRNGLQNGCFRQSHRAPLLW